MRRLCDFKSSCLDWLVSRILATRILPKRKIINQKSPRGAARENISKTAYLHPMVCFFELTSGRDRCFKAAKKVFPTHESINFSEWGTDYSLFSLV